MRRSSSRGLPARFEKQKAERGKVEPHGVFVSVGCDRLREDHAAIADIAAAVHVAVAVQQLEVGSTRRNAYPIAFAGDRREIRDRDKKILAVLRAAYERYDAVLAVVAVNPLESGRIEVDLVQRMLGPVDAVQILDELPQALVQRLIQRMPIQAVIVVPLARLSELAAHEHELLAGVRVHEAVQRAKRRGLLPVVARDFAEHGAFAMDDLVVRERHFSINKGWV